MVFHDTDSYRAYEAIPPHVPTSTTADLKRREDLIALGWQPHPKYGPDFLVEPAKPDGKKGSSRRSVYIPA